MYVVKLINEYIHGPLWVCGKNGIETDCSLIDNDKELQFLNEQAAILFDSFFDFDVGDKPCVFDNDGYKAAFPKMKELINQIKKRLEEINDGSFIVEDYISNQQFD
jgi:hypothetical protein